MPALTPDTPHTATSTLSDLTDYLRENPDPLEALAVVETLLDEYMDLPLPLVPGRSTRTSRAPRRLAF
ncbi:hypothetical protein AB0N97_16000 [Streptomyces collinus]|uniref:hypothetical protein n=1 Tax=Streptomyces collinus TaxID=42684 RepID=UPI00342B043A